MFFELRWKTASIFLPSYLASSISSFHYSTIARSFRAAKGGFYDSVLFQLKLLARFSSSFLLMNLRRLPWRSFQSYSECVHGRWINWWTPNSPKPHHPCRFGWRRRSYAEFLRRLSPRGHKFVRSLTSTSNPGRCFCIDPSHRPICSRQYFSIWSHPGSTIVFAGVQSCNEVD
jgi:hypothetical protein